MRTRSFPLAAAVSMLLAIGARADSFEHTLDVQEGSRLVVEHSSGTLLVQAWEKDVVRLEAHHDDDASVEMRRRGLRVIVEVAGDHGAPEDVDLELWVPRWMPVTLEGREVEAEIEGTEAPVVARLLGGDIFVVGGRGTIDLRSVHGEITLRDAEGEIDLESTNEDIRVRDCSGTLVAESVHGDLRMDAVDMRELELITTNGDIVHDGRIEPDGDYFLSTHDGEIHVSLPKDADVLIEILAYEGEVHPPAQFTGTRVKFDRERRLREWQLGEGRAHMRIESFRGDVHLYDPKQGRGKRD